MHEMSLMQSVVSILEEEAARQNFTQVKAVWLEIGKLSHVEPEALRFCFDVVIKDTVADGARLEIVEIPGQAWCMNCSKSVEVAERFDACPDCGGYQLQMTGGDEMRIKELEVA